MIRGPHQGSKVRRQRCLNAKPLYTLSRVARPVIARQNFWPRKASSALLITGPAQPNRVVLEPEQLAYPLFVKPYDDFVVYDGGRGGLGVHLDHLLYCIEVGTDIFLDEIDISLR